MAIEQHYYTSWAGPSNSGFHTRAISPGLGANLIREVEAHVGYKIPAEVMTQPMSEHPVVLKYLYRSPSEVFLIHIVSSGGDEGGRAGNFFAHSLIASVESMVESYAPIFQWGNNTWVLQDPNPGVPIRLSSMETLPPNNKFNYRLVYQFIQQRRPFFANLLSAVITFPITNRRIVIADNPENVMLWIAGISMALPAQVASQLSFTTYHPTYKGVPFIITGVTSETSFNLGDMQGYFILDPVNNRCSEVEVGDYARFVADHYSENFQEVLGELHNQMATSQFSFDIKNYALHVDNFLNLYAISSSHLIQYQSNTASLLNHTNTLIDQLEVSLKKSVHNVTYVQNLIELLLYELSQKQNDSQLVYLKRLLGLYRQYDQNIAQTTDRVLSLSLKMLEQGNLEVARSILIVMDAYSHDAVQVQVNSSKILTKILNILKGQSVGGYHFFWEVMGPSLKFSPLLDKEFQQLIHMTLDSLVLPILQYGGNDDSVQYKIPSQQQSHILKLILKSGLQVEHILTATQTYASRNKSMAYAWMYYQGIILAPDKRQIYQKLGWAVTDPIDVRRYEVYRDLLGVTDTEQRMITLRRWCKLVPDTHASIVIVQGVFDLWKGDAMSKDMAIALLLDRDLIQIAERKYSIWCSTIFKVIESVDFAENAQVAEIYKRVFDGELKIDLLPEQLRRFAVLQVTNKNSLSRQDAENLHDYFTKMPSAEKYLQEVDRFIARFFIAQENVSETHINLVYMVYVPDFEMEFWDIYWRYSEKTLLSQKNTKDWVIVMETWFENRYQDPSLAYLTASYMIQLPGWLTMLAKTQKNQLGKLDLEDVIMGRPWYRLIRHYIEDAITKSNRGFWGLIGGRK